MAEITLTNEQQAAIGAKGRPILVSAAAGSGKTFVLVNRLMEKITAPDSGRDITDFLVITYTRAAAAELRSRIRKELNDRLNEESGLSAAQRKHLRRQILLVQKAQISTIHSFCSALLKENAPTLGIRPDFSLMDETEAGDRKNAALERVMEEAYARVDSDPSFAALTELLVDQNRDHRLSAAVLNTLAGKNAKLTKADGAALKSKELVGSGMLLTKEDGKVLTVIVKGDTNGDGRITAADARFALRAAVELERPNEWQLNACQVSGRKKITAAVARFILRAAVGIETLEII